MSNFSTKQNSTTTTAASSTTMTERKGTTELKLTPVFLHVYVIDHKLNPPLLRIGVGMYHSAVEIQFSDAMPREYSFGVNGLFQNTPKQGCGCTYLKSILLGYTSLQVNDVENIVEKMQRDRYNEEAYNILLRNCNHFTNEFAKLVVQYKDKEGRKKLRKKKRHVPKFVNRIAQLGSRFACFFPKDFLK